MLLLIGLLAVRQMFGEAAVSDTQLERQVLARLQVIDVERILNNNRIINKYLKCMLRQGVCPPEARDFRRVLPKLIKHLCEKCTDRQRTALKQIFTFVRTKFPKEWEQMKILYATNPEDQIRMEKFAAT
ncbi:ejaculatory bulb-specific protein 3-like [Halyomorpha halys]|uniref:ejaculatory bulb-specific protein 3-like n=1 Tax=Halyomorpha halys TaxID=286706 RepID=UPI0006D4E38F